MKPVCIRLDLDSTPWDTSSGFGVEQARLVALFDFARHSGVKFHVFASSRTLRATPSLIDTVLGDGHDLDWLHTGDSLAADWEQAGAELVGTGHSWWGVGLTGLASGGLPESVRFCSQLDGETVFLDDLPSLATVIFPLASAPTAAIEAGVLQALGSGHTIRTARDILRDP